MSDNKQSTSTKDQTNNSKGDVSLTGVPTGSSGEHLAATGASALGSSAASGDMGNEKSKIDRAMDGAGPSGTTTASSPTVANDQGTR